MNNDLTKKAIEQRYGIHLPAGLNNLGFSNREAIKSEHKRRIERIREKLKKGQPVTEKDLQR